MKINGKEWKREGGIEIAEEIHTKQKLKRLRSLLQATCLLSAGFIRAWKKTFENIQHMIVLGGVS